MRIEDDDQKVGSSKRSDLIKQIQQYQEQQDQVHNEGGLDPQKLEQMSTQDLLQELKSIAGASEQQAADIEAQDAQSMAARDDVQSSGQEGEIARIEQSHSQVNQTEKSAEAVDSAHKQQDAGQNWEKFAQSKEAAPLPPSVEEAAREAQKEEAERDQSRISARDFQSSMAMRNRMIKS